MKSYNTSVLTVVKLWVANPLFLVVKRGVHDMKNEYSEDGKLHCKKCQSFYSPIARKIKCPHELRAKWKRMLERGA